MRTPRRWAGSAVLSVSVLLVAAGCGGGGGSGDSIPEAVEEPTTGVTFVDPLTGGNKWLPLKPGTRWVREGTTKIGKREVTHQVISTVTDLIREIDGIKAVAVLDEERGGGEVTDKSLDWLAQDSNGNIWWLGAVTETYRGGKLTGIEEAWVAGRNKAKRGLLVPADPAGRGKPWRMATPPGEKGDQAGFTRNQTKECVPFGCYENVLVISEGLKSDEVEDKLYAAGVGQIRNSPQKSHDEDVEQLANLTTLSAEGLTEASTEAKRLDAAALEEEKANYGEAEAARVSAPAPAGTQNETATEAPTP